MQQVLRLHDARNRTVGAEHETDATTVGHVVDEDPLSRRDAARLGGELIAKLCGVLDRARWFAKDLQYVTLAQPSRIRSAGSHAADPASAAMHAKKRHPRVVIVSSPISSALRVRVG